MVEFLSYKTKYTISFNYSFIRSLDPFNKMLNNKAKTVQDNNHNKCNRNQQKNIKGFYKKVQEPKVFFNLLKHTRILDQDVPKIESEDLEMPELKTICDVDESFYKVIEGRPLRNFVDIKVYIRNIRDIALDRASTAYLKDIVIRIDTSFADELKEYDKVYKLFDQTKSNYFHFIENSYKNALEIQKRADALSEKLENKMNKLNSLSFMYVKLNNKIGSLAAVFGSLFRYGYFLNQMYPIWWKAHYDIKSSVDFTKVFQEAESNPTQSFEIYKAYFMHACVKPKIGFKKPQTLIRVFDEISRQCLNYLEIQNYSANIVRSVLKSRDHLETKILTEMNEVTDLIVFYEQQVKWMEEKEATYKNKFNKLLFNEFHDLYASYDSTKLFTSVQFVHFRLFQGPEDPRDDIKTLVVDIEKLFINLTSGLDYLNQNVVKAVQHEVFSSDIKIIRRAKRAQRVLKECDILKKSLIASFEAPRYFHKKTSI